MFENIVGQENAAGVLRSMLQSDRIPHTLLFAGPYGVGKSEAAFEMARILLCENGVDSGCSTCGSCSRTRKLEHPDLHLLFPLRMEPTSKAEHDKWVEELVEHKMKLASEMYNPIVYKKALQIIKGMVYETYLRLMAGSLEGGRKVCIILDADRLNPTTGNALLKILEEPPEGVYFILTTERLSSVLPTIVSRASITRFRRLKTEEIVSYLADNGIDDIEKRTIYAQLGEGSIKGAKEYAFNNKADVRSQAFQLYTSVASGNDGDVISNVMPFLKTRDILEIEEILNGYAICTRLVLKSKVGIEYDAGEYTEKLYMLSRKTDISSLNTLSARLEEGLDMLSRNVNIQMVLTSINYEIYNTYRKRYSN